MFRHQNLHKTLPNCKRHSASFQKRNIPSNPQSSCSTMCYLLLQGRNPSGRSKHGHKKRALKSPDLTFRQHKRAFPSIPGNRLRSCSRPPPCCQSRPQKRPLQTKPAMRSTQKPPICQVESFSSLPHLDNGKIWIFIWKTRPPSSSSLAIIEIFLRNSLMHLTIFL